MRQFQKRLWPEDRGQSLSEYALLFVLLALMAIAAMTGLAGSVSNLYSDASAHAAIAASQRSISTGSVSGNNITTDDPSNTEDNTVSPH